MPRISLNAYLSKLDELIKEAHYDEAIHHAQHITDTFPKNVAAFRRLGKSYMGRNRLKDAAQVYRRILSVYPDDLEAHVSLSRIARHENRGEEAIWHMERAIEANPKNTDLLKQLRALYKEFRSQDSGKPPLTARSVARQQINAGLYQRAIDTLSDAIERNPKRVDLQILLAETLWEIGSRVEAAEVSVEVLKVLPDAMLPNCILTELWLNEQRPSDAQYYLTRIEAIDPYLAYEMVQGTPPADDILQLEELDYRTQAQRELSTRSPDWLASIDSEESGSESESPELQLFDEGEEDSMLIETALGEEAIRDQRPSAIESSDTLDENADIWEYIEDEETEDVEEAPAAKATEDDLSDLFGDSFDELAGLPQGSTGLTGLLGTLETGEIEQFKDSTEHDELDDLFAEAASDENTGLTGLLGSVEENEKPRTPRSRIGSGLTGLLSMLDGGKDEEEPEEAEEAVEEEPEEENDPLAWMKDSGLHDAVTRATAPLESSQVDSLFEDMAAQLNQAETSQQEGTGDLEEAEAEAPESVDEAPVDSNDPLAWMKQSGIEIDENAEMEDLFADAFDDEQMDAQLAQSKAEDPMAWMKSSGIDFDSDTGDLLGDVDEPPVAEVDKEDPLAWMKQSGIGFEDQADEDDLFADADEEISDRADLADSAQTLTGTDADDDIDLFRDDDDVLDEMLFMEDLAFSDGEDVMFEDDTESTDTSATVTANDDDLGFADEDEDDVAFDAQTDDEFLMDASEETLDEEEVTDEDILFDELEDEVSAEASTDFADEIDEDEYQGSEIMSDEHDEGLPNWLDDSSDDDDIENIEWLNLDDEDDEAATQGDAAAHDLPSFDASEDDSDQASEELDWMTDPEALLEELSEEDASMDESDAFDLFSDVEDDDEETTDEDLSWAATMGAGVADALDSEMLFDDDNEDTDQDEEDAPDWLEEVGGEEIMAGLFDDESDENEDSTPDWLSEIGGDELSGEDEFEDEDIVEEPEDMPDWLAQAAPESDDELEEDELEEDDELAFLMQDDEDTQDEDEFEEPQGMPDWLAQAAPESDEELEEDEFEEVPDLEEDDELAFLMQDDDDTEDEDEFEEPEGMPDWLAQAAPESDEEFEEEELEEDDELAFLMQDDEDEDEEFDLEFIPGDEDEETLIGQASAETADVPDWLVDADMDEDEAQEDDAPDWIVAAGLGAAGAAAAGALMDDEEDEAFEEQEDVPDWLSAVEDQVQEEAQEEPEEEFDYLSPDETPAWLESTESPGTEAADDYEDEDQPDWLTGLGDVEEEPEEAEPVAEFEEDVPDWLSDVGDTEAYEEDEESEEEFALFSAIEEDAELIDYDDTAGEMFEEIEPSPASNAPDWLNAMVPGLDVDYEDQAEDAPLEPEFLEDAAIGAEYGWLNEIVDEELSPPTSLPPAAPAPAPDEEAPQKSRFSFGKRPSWLPKLSKRPAWMQKKTSDKPAEDESSTEQLSDDELPPWLQFDDDE